MREIHHISLTLILFFLLLSCNKEKLPDIQKFNAGTGVFICNEGNFTYGNGSLSFFEFDTEQVYNQVFYNTNNFPLGDVVQSMAIKDSLGFIVVNNSGKIHVINTSTFKHIATITGFTSPRYIEFVNDSKAYVSDLYNNSVAVVDLHNYSLSGSVKIGCSTEKMVRYSDFIFAISWSYSNKVFKINCLTDQLIDSIEVTYQPNSIVLDKDNKLWVLSDGGIDGSQNKQHAAICRIDPVLFEIEQVIKWTDWESSPTKLTINGNKDTLYFINGSWGSSISNSGIYKMSVYESVIPEHPLIESGNHLYYGLGIDPATSEIYTSDAIDYNQKGYVFRYTSHGHIIDSFKVDIIPSEFCFKK